MSAKRVSPVLVVIDNAPVYPSLKLLEQENGVLTVEVMPTNITIVLKLTSKNLIATSEKLYRKILSSKLLFT